MATRSTSTATVRPMLATLADLPSDDEAWAYEVKWDGIRAVAFVDAGVLRLETRTGNDVTAQYPELHELPTSLVDRHAVLDGEIVTMDDAGRPSFERLQSRMGLSKPATILTRSRTVPTQYVAFDLLELDDEDLRGEPYERRRELLHCLLPADAIDAARWQAPQHQVGNGEALLDAIVEQGMEGIVAKRLGSTYHEGRRGKDWRKVKRQRRQEFVIGGWTDGAGSREGSIGSLLVGYHEGDQLHFAGGVGSGLADREIDRIVQELAPLARDTSPFDVGLADVAHRALGRWGFTKDNKEAAVHFIEPRLVCEVEYTQFTGSGMLRHPVYKGLRPDKPAGDVVREDR